MKNEKRHVRDSPARKTEPVAENLEKPAKALAKTTGAGAIRPHPQGKVDHVSGESPGPGISG